MNGKHRKSSSSGIIFFSFFIVLVALRIGSAVYLNPGYLHPDEVFQSLELASHDFYPENCNLLTWEFKLSERGPVRSRSAIWPFVHLPILMVDYFFPPKNASSMSGDESVKRIMLPTRVWAVLLSFIPDVFIFWLSQQLGGSPFVAIFLYASMTYGGFVWGARTLSNALETVAVSIFCYLSVQNGIICLVLQAVISVLAIFLRPSFPFFVFPFVIFQLWSMIRSSNRYIRIFIHIPIALFTAVCIAVLLCISDTIYYTGKSTFKLSELIITPIRFFTYNTRVETLSEHGLHPWYHYMLVHWPVVLTPIFTVLAFWPPKSLGKNDGLRYTCWSSLIFATAFLSLIAHKEPRFLLPCFPIAVVLASMRIKSSSRLLLLWVIYQIALAIFWGFLHQGGLLPFLRSLEPLKDQHIAVNIFYNTYMPARFPFTSALSTTHSVARACQELVPMDLKCNRIVDFGGRPQSELLAFLNCLKSQANKNMVARLILPGSIDPPDIGQISKITKVFPHLSTEHLPNVGFPRCSFDGKMIDCLTDYWKELKSQLSLHIYEIVVV